MFCPQCGAQNDDKNKYCTECGKSLALGFHQPTSTTKPLLPGVACHYSGCTEPVIGQCPGYMHKCMRYYCAKHSVEHCCSICAEEALYDTAIWEMYQDYIKSAANIPMLFTMKILFPIALFLWWIFAILGGDIFIGALLAGCVVVFLGWFFYQTKQEAVDEVAITKPGFKEFFAKYESAKNSEYGSISRDDLSEQIRTDGVVATAFEEYKKRIDVREIIRTRRF